MKLKPIALAIYQAYGKQTPLLMAAWRVERRQFGKITEWRPILPNEWGRFA